MKAVRLCVLGVLIAVFASCYKLQDNDCEDASKGEFLKAEICFGLGGGEAVKGAGGGDNGGNDLTKSALFANENNISTITLWLWEQESGKLITIETFTPAAPPSLFLRRGDYTFAATANLIVIDPTRLDTPDKVQTYYNKSYPAQGKNGVLPLFCQGTSSTLDTTILFRLLFAHSWAKISFSVDGSGLNNAFEVTSVKLKSYVGAEFDRLSASELGRNASGDLYCPTISATATETAKPYVEVTGNLSTSFTGTVTYRIRVSPTEPEHYSYTLKPTLAYLVSHDQSWEISGDYGLGDFSKCLLDIKTTKKSVNSMYEGYYPDCWTELPSTGSSTIGLTLKDAAQGIDIPNKWYNIDVTTSNSTLMGKTAVLSTYTTKQIGEITYSLSSSKAPEPLQATVTSIWQPLIEYYKAVPKCPDSRYPDCHLGISQTNTAYTGTMRSRNGTYSFTASVTNYNGLNCILGTSATSSSITVTGRSENPPFLLVTDDLMIISHIEKQTANATWGSASNLKITRQNISYTLPSNYIAAQKYVFPNIPVESQEFISIRSRPVTINGIKVR